MFSKSKKTGSTSSICNDNSAKASTKLTVYSIRLELIVNDFETLKSNLAILRLSRMIPTGNLGNLINLVIKSRDTLSGKLEYLELFLGYYY